MTDFSQTDQKNSLWSKDSESRETSVGSFTHKKISEAHPNPQQR